MWDWLKVPGAGQGQVRPVPPLGGRCQRRSRPGSRHRAGRGLGLKAPPRALVWVGFVVSIVLLCFPCRSGSLLPFGKETKSPRRSLPAVSCCQGNGAVCGVRRGSCCRVPTAQAQEDAGGVGRAVLGALLSGWDPLLPPLQGKGPGAAAEAGESPAHTPSSPCLVWLESAIMANKKLRGRAVCGPKGDAPCLLLPLQLPTCQPHWLIYTGTAHIH